MLGEQALWEKLARTLLKHLSDSSLIVEALVTKFLHDHFNSRLNEFQDARLDFGQELLRHLVGVRLLLDIAWILNQVACVMEGLIVLRRHQWVVTVLLIEDLLARAVSDIVLMFERASHTGAPG